MDKIDISSVATKFNKHLIQEGNTHIIFSGKFGIGKSFFLKEFFELEEQKSKYNALFISPVNYAVASNENIFELIKVDIIKQLFITQKLKFEEAINIDKFKAIKKYATKHPLELVKNISKALSKLSLEGAVLSAVSEGVYQLIQDLSKFEDALNKDQSSKTVKLQEQMSKLEDIPGSYLEFNIISEIICNVLVEIKQTKCISY